MQTIKAGYVKEQVYQAAIEACIFTDETNWEDDNEGLNFSAKLAIEKLVDSFLEYLESINAEITCTRRNQYTESEMLGHDLWLTINGHGAGFWDGDWEGKDVKKVTEWCEGKSMETYVGDDGYVYILGHE